MVIGVRFPVALLQLCKLIVALHLKLLTHAEEIDHFHNLIYNYFMLERADSKVGTNVVLCIDGTLAHKIKIESPSGSTSIGICIRGCTFKKEYRTYLSAEELMQQSFRAKGLGLSEHIKRGTRDYQMLSFRD